MIDFNNVFKYYHVAGRQHEVIKGLTISFPPDKTVGIVGANGAGKSTLLRLACGVESPSSGSVSHNGSISWALGLQGGFQGSLTGRQNSNFVAKIHGQGENAAEIADFVAHFAEIEEQFDSPVKKYSNGMRSRLAFAMSLAFRFDYYIVDEITSVGDRQFRAKSAAAFQQLRGQAGILLVTHDMRLVRDSCDLAYLLEDGTLRLLAPAEITAMIV